MFAKNSLILTSAFLALYVTEIYCVLRKCDLFLIKHQTEMTTSATSCYGVNFFFLFIIFVFRRTKKEPSANADIWVVAISSSLLLRAIVVQFVDYSFIY